MNENTILEVIQESLEAITNPHFYRDERGFQGEFLGEMRNRLTLLNFDGAVIQQEYQKRLPDHGITIRPDLIVHIPFEDSGFDSRLEGNFVVIELKRNATQQQALADYENLSLMCERLNYPLAVFINIGSDNTFINQYQGTHKDRIRAFGVELVDDVVSISEDRQS